MKTLTPVSSKKRNPTEHADYNDAISYDYLVIVNGCYGRGTFSFISNKWMVIEQFHLPISRESQHNADLNKQREYSFDEVIWFEEK
jgi:hypothetical protein